jgi:hypothetical protein
MPYFDKTWQFLKFHAGMCTFGSQNLVPKVFKYIKSVHILGCHAVSHNSNNEVHFLLEHLTCTCLDFNSFRSESTGITYVMYNVPCKPLFFLLSWLKQTCVESIASMTTDFYKSKWIFNCSLLVKVKTVITLIETTKFRFGSWRYRCMTNLQPWQNLWNANLNKYTYR